MSVGRTAIVTGAAGAVGSAITRRLVKEGMTVGGIDIAEAQLRETVEQAALPTWCALDGDIRDRRTMESHIRAFQEQAGCIDLVVHAVGILRTARLMDIAEEQWDEVFDTNVTGRFIVSQVAASTMIESGTGGVIVDVGSFTGERVSPGRIHYCVGNAVAETLCRAMAVDLGKYGIRVVNLRSGPIRTPMLAGRADDPERLARFLKNIPLGRLAEPEDIADAVLFLADEESGYITGSVLNIDGGWLAG
jgi:NAD(P)-dependent dehydrogenase (short-subunit alcohol dehydrogenase family)